MSNPLPPWLVPLIIVREKDSRRDPKHDSSGCGCLLFFLSAVLVGAALALLR